MTLLNESSIEQINLFAANANDSHHRVASSIASSCAADGMHQNNNSESYHHRRKEEDVVDLGALLASQDSNVFKVSSEVANAENDAEYCCNTENDHHLNRVAEVLPVGGTDGQT